MPALGESLPLLINEINCTGDKSELSQSAAHIKTQKFH